MTLSFSDLEIVYERLAQAIDEVGEEKTPLFLAKLALTLARQQDDREAALTAVDECQRDIQDEVGPSPTHDRLRAAYTSA
jgi:hypothetical protein